jgi:hypothetical protein
MEVARRDSSIDMAVKMEARDIVHPPADPTPHLRPDDPPLI